jgi:hypothetical protein
VPALHASFAEVRMDITRIWMSQRGLRRAGQIPAMVETLKRGDELPRITLVRGGDGEVQLHDGHHRLTAFWLAGRRELQRHEYLLLEQDRYHRPRFGRIDSLLKRLSKEVATMAGMV